MQKYLLLVLVSIIVLASCQKADEKQDPVNLINSEGILEHVTILASDDFLGRMPFTEGETKTLDYLETQFRNMGLKPGNGDSYFQEVPMVELNATLNGEMIIKGENGEIALSPGSEYVALSRQVKEQIELNEADLIFAGYGIDAPEYDWNDYEGLDVEGKIVIVRVNDPGFGTEDSLFFKGNTMTYYGRWTYKYEEAARKGAAGVIVIHQTIPAGYPWGVVEGGWSGPQLNLENEEGNMDRCPVEGWISFDSFKKIVELSGNELSMLDEAKKSGFKAIPLGVNASLGFENSIKRSSSKNVIATYPGTEKADEHIILTAHWDHLGVGKVVDGDSIYNGAVDNASGTACLLEIAKAFSVGKIETKRSVTFLAVTAEEQGLLGSAWYSANPVIEPNKTIANINMDALNPNGPMSDLTVVGSGQSELEDLALPFVEAQGRYMAPDHEPGKGYFFRSDHFNFAKIGVPAFYAKGGYDHMEKGAEYAEEARMDYLTNQYHKPQDEVDTSSIDLRGMVQDAQLFFMMTKKLAQEDIYPEWKEGSEFKAIREESLNN